MIRSHIVSQAINEGTLSPRLVDAIRFAEHCETVSENMRDAVLDSETDDPNIIRGEMLTCIRLADYSKEMWQRVSEIMLTERREANRAAAAQRAHRTDDPTGWVPGVTEDPEKG